MLTGLKLLLVEDDEDDYILTRDLLEEMHPGQVTLNWVTSVKDALEILREQQHDLCLVDFQLGAENGLQLIRYAQEAGLSTPIIMLTGHHDSELDIQAQRAGAVDYLVKHELNSSSLGRSIRYARARRQAEGERLQRLQAESENRSKSQFLTHLSHELRTPLTSILGYTELLLMKERDAKKLQELRTIERNGRHLLNLLNDVLDLSKIEAGKLDLEPRAVKLEELLADVQSQLAVRAMEKDIELNFSAAGDIPETIYTDPTRLQQILVNLLGNAIKFTERGKVDLLVSMISDQNQSEQMAFQVIDTGIGISESALNTIFEPFSQSLSASRQNREVGFGLGLSISLELAKKLGGSIVCESKPGAGSTFTLVIGANDLENISRRPMNIRSREDLPLTFSQTSLAGRILIADDLADIRQLLGSILARSGAEVVFASDGNAAVQEVLAREDSSEPIDAVIMDLQMPVVDGFSALQTLRGKGFERPVIALTASAMHGERERCIQAGFTDYLGKPVDIENLLGVLATHLGETAQHTGKGTVLLVEDDDDARRATTTLISHLGWQVLPAANAAEALARIAEHSAPISLALIDLGLPDIDGYALAQKIRASDSPAMRIIALSGAHTDSQRLERAGFDSHILKPMGLRQLSELLLTVGEPV